jgi:hypothetical protein
VSTGVRWAWPARRWAAAATSSKVMASVMWVQKGSPGSAGG